MENKIKKMKKYYAQYRKMANEIEREINEVIFDHVNGESAIIGVFEDEGGASMIVLGGIRRDFDAEHAEFIIKNKTINFDLPGC